MKCAIALACLLAGLPAAFAEDVTAIAAKEIRSYTGRCTRIVWVRSSGGIGSPFGPNKGEAWTIMAMDTDDGGKERALIQQRGDFHHTMITPTGTRVIWTDGSSRVWIADWDGKNVKKLMEPFLAVGVAEDPHGTEWVYVDTGKKVHASNTDQIAEIVRFQIDDLSKKELAWNKSGCNDKWEFTRDGKIGASGLPWPNAGVVSLPNGNLLNFGVGCTPGVSGDGTLVEHMNPGGHRGVYIYNADGSNKRYIDFRVSENPANTGEDPQFWWVSFARYDKRFMTMSGPHPSLGYKQSKGNIIFMVLNATFSGMAKYIMVTNYPEVETHAYAWIGDPTMAPEIVTQPADQTVDEGQQATFTVEAVASPEPTYQWQQNGADIPGATKASYTVTAARANRDATFRCVVTNSKGRARSDEARLIVNLRGPGPEVVEEWDRKFLARLRDSLKAGKSPALSPESKRNRREVLSIDARGMLKVEMSRGMQVGMPLERLTADEKVALVLSILDEQKESDRCLAGFYLFMAGKDDDAERHLKKGGKGADAVRALFR